MSQDFPEGWTKTIDDLVAEKRDLSGEEIAWARSYEREQLRSWAQMTKPFMNLADVVFTDVEENGYSTSRRAQFSAG